MAHLSASPWRAALAGVAAALVAVLVLAGCGEESHGATEPSAGTGGQSGEIVDPGETPTAGDGATDFVSHFNDEETHEILWRYSGTGGTGTGGASAGTGGSGSPGADPTRAITEADIIRVEGNTLYALSRYSGLTIIDLTEPAALRVLGHYPGSATPFEFYLEGGTAYIMYDHYEHREWDDAAGDYAWQTSSRLLALDVSTPETPRALGFKDLPGTISDSRKVGDILYVVSHESPGCWQCDAAANTRISSFDVSDPTVFAPIDQERFDAPAESGPRHVSVSTARMYVSGTTEGQEGAPLKGSIQVVDISDPGGRLEPGAVVEVAGQIENRWQMDEYEGALRVISQPSTWTSVPVVETFAIASSNELTPLATLPMVLPTLEPLKSARFDGPRVFAVTFLQTDPLFTFDLTDPANPVQVGELEIPGFLYHMEPRGDRLYALGFDDTAADGALHVSIFDVSNLATPSLLDRVNFGAAWAWLPEDQDRIHKALNLALDQELILAPFAGFIYDATTCTYDQGSGIQLIDAVGDDLTLRGLAPQVGAARRALLHGGVLYGISDDAVQSFDITDRDDPVPLDGVTHASDVMGAKVAGDDLLRFRRDWWTGELELDLVPLAAAEEPESSVMLDLSSLAAIEPTCSQANGDRSASESHFTGQVLVHGGYAFVPRQVDEGGYIAAEQAHYRREQMFITIVNLESGPTVVGEIALDPGASDYETTNTYAGIAHTDSALLVGRLGFRYDVASHQYTDLTFAYDVVDLTAGADAAVVSRIEVPSSLVGGGWSYSPERCLFDMGWGWSGSTYGPGMTTVVSGNVVASQHHVPLDDGTRRTRYYLDRIDVTDPANPVMLPPVNIPGKVLHYEHARSLLVTVDEVPEVLPELSDATACYADGRGVVWEYDETAAEDYANVPGTCTRWSRRLHSLIVEGSVARRVTLLALDEVEADGTQRAAGSIAVSDSRVFYETYAYAESTTLDGYRSWTRTDAEIAALGFAPDGQLSPLGSIAVDLENSWDLVARGHRAFRSGDGVLHVTTSPDDAAPTAEEYELRAGSCYPDLLEVVGDQAFCAGGEYGLQRIDL